jgi:hypothetical protein
MPGGDNPVSAASEGLALLDAGVDPRDPRIDAITRRIADGVDLQVDLHLAALAEIAPPAPGFDRRLEQKRYDRLQAELDDWVALRDEIAVNSFAIAEWALDQVAARAEADARTFDLQLQEILNDV